MRRVRPRKPDGASYKTHGPARLHLLYAPCRPVSRYNAAHSPDPKARPSERQEKPEVFPCAESGVVRAQWGITQSENPQYA